MSSAPGSTEKLPRRRRLFNVVESPYWFPEDIVKAREQLPDNLRLTRSKLRTQQRQQSLHSTPKKGQPLDWPEVEVEDWTVDQPHILTPNDFIVGRQDTNLVPGCENIPHSRLGNRWRQLETLGNQLWHRFIAEILPELASRQKWRILHENLKVGALVIVMEPGLPRNVWKTGLVTKVEQG